MGNKPLGVPVSVAMRLPSGPQRELIKSALAAIDSAHGDGELPFCGIVIDDGIKGRGEIRKGAETGLPEIAINPYSPPLDIIATVTHEVGHLIDRFGLSDGSSWASTSLTEMDVWREVVANSAPIRHFHQIRTQETQTMPPEMEMKMVQYYLRKEEIFARSYVQYVASRGDAADLKRWLDFERDTRLHAVYPTQWADEAFEPIGAIFDALFRSKKWLR